LHPTNFKVKINNINANQEYPCANVYLLTKDSENKTEGTDGYGYDEQWN
jgi:hypothetical protein